MSQQSIFLPVMTMVLLTIVVWLVMYVRRIGYLSKNEVDPQKLSTPEKVNDLLPETVNNASNNFKNLFEVPVIFYVVCSVAFMTQMVDAFYLYAAWAFVILRFAHSAVQCSYNNVNHRFAAYGLSSLILWVMSLRLLIAVVTA